MNLTELASKRRIALIAAGLFLGILLVIGLVFRKPKLPDLTEISKPTFASLEVGTPFYSFSVPTSQVKALPKSKPLISFSAQTVTKSSAAQFAQKFGFAGEGVEGLDANDDKVYFWAKDKDVLTVSENGILSFDPIKGPNLGNTIGSEQDALNLLSSYTSATGLAEEETVVRGVRFLKFVGDEGAQDAEPNEADFVEVFLTRIADLTPVIREPQDNFYIYGRLSKEGTLMAFKYRVFETLGETSPPYPLKTLEEIKEAVAGGKASVVSVNTAQSDYDLRELLQVNITSVSLAFFADDKAQLLTPIYVLAGSGIVSGEVNAEVVVYLPAVKERYY